MIQGIDYAAIAPPLIVALAAAAVLVADAFGATRRVVALIDGAGLAAALVAVIALAFGDPRATFCLPADLRGGGPGAGQRSCAYAGDDFTLVFQGIMLAAALIVLLISVGEIGRTALPAGEFHFLLLAAIAGALTLAASRDLIMLVVSLETLSLPVFALVGLRRYDGESSEAALKMFLVSVISTAIMLFGVSLVYGATGAMHLDRIAAGLAHVPGDLKPVAAVGVVMVLAGFAFKVAAVPFHFWAPDVYQGAPLAVAAFLSVVSKAGGFAGLSIVVAVGFKPYAGTWGVVIGVMSALTMSIGNLIALWQRHAVRLLAWSSVAQSGYMLAPLAVGASGAGTLPKAVAATVTYVALYAVMNMGAFAVVSVAGRRLEDYRGLSRTNPVLAGAMAFFLICLAGLPPGVMGLFAKIVVFRAAVDGDATWLAVVMAVNSVVGLYYYLAWAARMFAPREEAVPVGSAGSAGPVVPVQAAGAAAGTGGRAAVSPAIAGVGRSGVVSADGAVRTGGAVGLAIGVAAAGAVVLSVIPQLVLQVTPL